MYYFIGIKGSGMAPLAEILHELGNDVCGSDIDKYIFIEEELKKRNIPIYSFDANNIKDGYTVIIGNAFSDDHVEVKAALANPTVKCYRYFEFLGKFMENFISISIAGTHGKTTTTSMLSNITLSANLDPTILVGGDVDAIHGNFKIGESEYFVTEACEYKASFLKFFPYIGIILNIDADHLDYYRDINPFDFINLISRATCVVTDSFHAVLYSLIYDRDFYYINNGNAKRVVDLLNHYSVLERTVEDFDKLKRLSEDGSHKYDIDVRYDEDFKKARSYIQNAI